jgi:hypothetical protein
MRQSIMRLTIYIYIYNKFILYNSCILINQHIFMQDITFKKKIQRFKKSHTELNKPKSSLNLIKIGFNL